ncbi:MAG TPA: bis(5'-nucleosyl)-tetraphosphatase (symmetrical) YqeK [Oscillatoriaceae cyanobacterium]
MAQQPLAAWRTDIRSWLEANLSPHRYQHSLGVAATARALAERYGADPERAELAGLLHDAAREWKAGALLETARAAGMPVGYLEEMAPMPCLHGPIGAELAEREFGVADGEVLAAISHHTLGRERMGLLEKVVFLADAIEPNRPDAPYIRELRARAEDDLDHACRRALDHTFDYLLRTHQPIHPVAAAARNWFLYCEKEKR